MLAIIARVFLFILRSRYPANVSTFTIINNRYGAAVARDLRKWERAAKRYLKAILDQDLLKRCCTESVTPTFLKFRIYRRNLRFSPVYKDCQMALLMNEIDCKRKLQRRLEGHVNICRNRVKSVISYLDFIHVKCFMEKIVNNYKCQVQDIHSRKFVKWGGVYKLSNLVPGTSIFNFSNYLLSEREKFLLSLGLSFCIPRFIFPKKEILLYFELLVHKLSFHKIYGNGNFNNIVGELKQTIGKLPKLFKYTYNLISKDDVNILKRLKKNESLVICKPDKGNGTVLLNKSDYMDKMESILHDESKFHKRNDDIYKVNIGIEDKINYQLRKLKKNNSITESVYNELYVSGSSPSVMYGLAKVHKEGVPLRPILAAYSSPSYRVTKFLITFIQHLTVNQYTLSNSYVFKEQIEQLEFDHEVYLASFDITSLFTNVPVKETLDIAVNLLFQNNEYVRNITKSVFKKLLELCISDHHFIFNKTHYEQYEGFAMGSPLSAPMANLFLCYHEEEWLNNCPDQFRPLIYRRYVDDTFLVFKKKEHIALFFDYLNGRHASIKFTLENENNSILSFLDLNIKKMYKNNKFGFSLSIFRKATYTGLGLNFHSYCYFNFKLNNIRTLVHRALCLCSSWFDFHEEIAFLLKYFQNNGYPEGVVRAIINKLLTNKLSPKPVEYTVSKMVMYVKLPFLNNECCSFIKRELKRILEYRYPYIDFRCVFVNNLSIQGLLSHKESLPMDLRSSLVYAYECGACGSTYLGQTKKCLRSRVGDHFGISMRTGRLLVSPTQSTIRDHLEVCGGGRNIVDFKSVRSFSDVVLLRIYESLEIFYKTPNLNRDGSSFNLKLV